MENQAKFCAHCGSPLQPGQNFCANCGAMQTVAQTTVQTAASIIPPTAKKSRKKVWLGIGVSSILALTIFVILMIVMNIGGKDRTIMVYMIGSDLESQAAAASIDITEMQEANFDPEHTKLLVYTGGTKKWALDDISAEENAIFEIVDGQINKVQSYDRAIMTEPETLISFINFAYEKYPADLYDLILWDHGGGPIFGYGSDENSLSGSPMKIPTLAKALAETKLVTSGKKFDLIGFDACLMGNAEIAKTLSNYSDYMIASEEAEPGDGWNYKFLNSLGTESQINTSEDLGRSIIDNYFSSYDNYPYDVDLSMSLIDLRKIDQLTNSVDSLFSLVKEEITGQTFSQYSRLMTREKVYGYTGRDSESYDLVDLIDLCRSLKDSHSSEIGQIENNFNDAVLYNRSNMENTNGLSVYFLNFNKSAAEEMLKNYKDVAFSDKYYDFLTKYKNFVTSDRKVSKNLYKNLPEETTEDNTIEIDLPDELVDNYQSGEIIIFRKLGDNKFMPVYRSSEVELVDNKLKAATYNLQFVVEITEPDGNITYGWTAMFEKERTDSYADYTTYGSLYYSDDSTIIGFSPQSYEMHLRIPSGSNEAQIKDIRPLSTTELASRRNLEPDKIKFIDFTIGTYKLFNDTGELDYNMESYGTQYGSEANLEEGDTYKFKLVGLDFDFGDIFNDEFSNLADYYAEFVVHDTQGDSHRLNLVHIDQ